MRNLVEAVVSLVQLLGWNSITVLQEAEDNLSSFHDLLPMYMNYTYLMQFDLRRTHLREDVFNFLESRIYERRHRNVVVLCHEECLVELMHQINLHDHTRNEQGLFTFSYRWIIVAEESFLEYAQQSVHNITHLTAVSWKEEKQVGGGLQVIDNARNYLQNILSIGSVQCIDPAANDSPVLLDQMMFSIKLNSAAWKSDGRAFEVIGHFSPAGWQLTHPVFPNEEYGLNGRHFIIVTNLWGPFMDLISTEDKQNLTFLGMCEEIIEIFADQLNFTYTTILPRDGLWGVKDENGTWSGIVRDISDKVADFHISPLGVLADREEVIDFAVPFYSEYTSALYKKPSADAKFNIFLKPYKKQVWISICFSIVFISVVTLVFARTGLILTKAEATQDYSDIRNSAWYCFGALLSQGAHVLPLAPSLRTVLTFWWLFCSVVLATYSANLIAFLTVDIVHPPFRTLDQLVNQNAYQFGTLGASMWEAMFKSGHTYSRLWTRIQDFAGKGAPVLSPDNAEHIRRVRQGGYAYIADVTTFNLVQFKHCELAVMEKRFAPLLYGIGAQNNSVYTDIFSEQIVQLMAEGLLEKWKQTYWPKVLGCEDDTEFAKPIRLKDVQGIFFAASGLLVFSGCVLLAEMLLVKCRGGASWRQNVTSGSTGSAGITVVERKPVLFQASSRSVAQARHKSLTLYRTIQGLSGVRYRSQRTYPSSSFSTNARKVSPISEKGSELS